MLCDSPIWIWLRSFLYEFSFESFSFGCFSFGGFAVSGIILALARCSLSKLLKFSVLTTLFDVVGVVSFAFVYFFAFC